MSVRMNLNIGENLDSWIAEKANELGIAKNAFVIMCVANARNQEQNTSVMGNMSLLKQILDSSENEK